MEDCLNDPQWWKVVVPPVNGALTHRRSQSERSKLVGFFLKLGIFGSCCRDRVIRVLAENPTRVLEIPNAGTFKASGDLKRGFQRGI